MSGLYQRIRPRTFSGVVGQDATVRLIQAQPKTGVFFPVNLFIGEHGCGKTTVAEIMAMAMNCEHLQPDGSPCLECSNCKAVLSGNCGDVQEIDAASNNGVDFVRLFTEQASYLPMMLKKRVFILDEVHMLSNAAFNALLKLFENVPEHVRFILCTTDPQKIPKTVKSRCHAYTFGCIATETIRDYLVDVSRKNGYDIEPDACAVIARNSGGAMRDALVLLEQVAVGSGHLTAKEVSELLGASEESSLADLLHAVLSFDDRTLMEISGRYAGEGKNFETLCRELLSFIRDVKVAWWGGDVFGTREYIEILSGFRKYPVQVINELTALLYEARRSLRDDPTQMNFDVQMTVIEQSLRKVFLVEEKAVLRAVSSQDPVIPMEPVPVADAPETESLPECNADVPEACSADTAAEEPPFEEAAPKEPETAEETEVLLDDDGNVDFGDSFDFFNDDAGPAESCDENAERDSASEEKKVLNEGFMTVDENGTPFAENEDDGVDYPPFLCEGTGTCGENARECLSRLREVCRMEPAVLSSMKRSFSGYPSDAGYVLVATDNAAFGCVSVYLKKYNVRNVVIKKTVA